MNTEKKKIVDLTKIIVILDVNRISRFLRLAKGGSNKVIIVNIVIELII